MCNNLIKSHIVVLLFCFLIVIFNRFHSQFFAYFCKWFDSPYIKNIFVKVYFGTYIINGFIFVSAIHSKTPVLGYFYIHAWSFFILSVWSIFGWQIFMRPDLFTSLQFSSTLCFEPRQLSLKNAEYLYLFSLNMAVWSFVSSP